MITLAIDASGRVAGVALVQDGELLSELTLCLGLTHSETLLPATVSLLSACNLSIEEVDLIAVAKGPGSFTGLRIAAATAKGLAMKNGTPLLGISTLSMLQENLSFLPLPIHVLLDARKEQVYTGSYLQGNLLREERACPLSELLHFAKGLTGQQVFMGDGVLRYREEILSALGGERVIFPSAASLLQRPSSLAFLAEKAWKEGKREAFHLEYLRKPQAEREKERGDLKDFQILKEEDAEKIGRTEDHLAAKNYPV